MTNILEVFSEKTGLVKDVDFVYTQAGETGYCYLTVYKDGSFLKLGEFYYEEWIRNRSNLLSESYYQEVLSVFCDECIKRMNNPEIEMPKTLYGNYYMIVRDWKDKVNFPQWLIDAMIKNL